MDESQRQGQMIDRPTERNKNTANFPSALAGYGGREQTRYISVVEDSIRHRAWLRVYPILATSLSRRVVPGSVCFGAQFLTEGSTYNQTSRCHNLTILTYLVSNPYLTRAMMTSFLIGASGVQVAHFGIKVSSPMVRCLASVQQ